MPLCGNNCFTNGKVNVFCTSVIFYTSELQEERFCVMIFVKLIEIFIETFQMLEQAYGDISLHLLPMNALKVLTFQIAQNSQHRDDAKSGCTFTAVGKIHVLIYLNDRLTIRQVLAGVEVRAKQFWLKICRYIVLQQNLGLTFLTDARKINLCHS